MTALHDVHWLVQTGEMIGAVAVAITIVPGTAVAKKVAHHEMRCKSVTAGLGQSTKVIEYAADWCRTKVVAVGLAELSGSEQQ